MSGQWGHIRYNIPNAGVAQSNAQTAGQMNLGRLNNQFQQQRDQSQFGYQRQLQADQLAQRDRDAQLNAELQRQGYANQQSIAQMQAEASKYPHLLKEKRFNQLFPMVQNVLGGQGGMAGMFGSAGGPAYTGQGQVGQQPFISDAPVYDNQQIQEQVNAQRAQGDAALAGKQRQMQQSMAGRGFGSRSPIAMAMSNALFGQNLAANTANESQLRFDAAGANAKQRLEGQQARERQFASRQQEEIERNKTRSGIISSLFGSLMGAL